MALSYVTYPADGVTTQYDITFGYLARSHVFVFVDDQLRSFRWVTGNRVELNLAPPKSLNIEAQMPPIRFEKKEKGEEVESEEEEDFGPGIDPGVPEPEPEPEPEGE